MVTVVAEGKSAMCSYSKYSYSQKQCPWCMSLLPASTANPLYSPCLCDPTLTLRTASCCPLCASHKQQLQSSLPVATSNLLSLSLLLQLLLPLLLP